MEKYLLLIIGSLCLIGAVTSDFVDIQDNEVTEYEPQAEYLRKWTLKFTELSEIPQCREVPKLSEEEKAINRTCPKTGKNLLCSNIFLFSVVRDMCAPYYDNEPLLRQGIHEIIEKDGLGKFAMMTFEVIYQQLEAITGVKITNFIKRDIQDLVMDVLQEIVDNQEIK